MIEKLNSNLVTIQQRIVDAAARSGRSASDVVLVGVTKYVDAATTKLLFEAGCKNLGESRPQVLWDKSAELEGLGIQWHMIGHLQRNKVKRTLKRTHLIHSVDSLRLMSAINEAAKSEELIANILLEVNVSGESAKHGFEPGEMEEALEAATAHSNIHVNGLMCMAGLMGGIEDARREFDSLRNLRDELTKFSTDNIELKELSMGMSGDYEAAIESGATLVRVGSSLFEGVQ